MARLANSDQDGIDVAIALDYRLRSPERPSNVLKGEEYLHVSGLPLDQVITKLRRNAAEGQQLAMLDGFGNECEGHCGV